MEIFNFNVYGSVDRENIQSVANQRTTSLKLQGIPLIPYY